uniref:cytochrome P450 n=1 Tax=Sciscionella sediminilitoris TaxID=1445613 RepID=UPI0004DF46CF
RLLTPAFSARRMNDLATLITTLVRESIEEMTGGAEHGTADLQRHISMPLPVFVICRLLGVPFADRYYFKDLSTRLATLTGQDPGIAYAELREYVGRIAEAKRTDPGEDLISDLVAAQQEYPEYLTGEQLTGIVAGLLFAGHETTLNAISYGTLALLSNPAAKQRLIAHPETVDEVVEEILRLNASGGIGILRYAHADIQVGEQLIRRGEAVILYSALVDRDPRAFADAERFAPAKRADTHLGFGHGGYFCIGASLARLELRGVFGQLFRRLPTLALAAGPEELTPRDERLTGGIERLPVSW